MKYYWSDLHLGHKNILNFRKGFSSLEEHDEHILDVLSKTLNKRDKIFLLGDNVFDTRSFNKLLKAIPVGCVIHYMGGNHDFERDKQLYKAVAASDRVSQFGFGLYKDRKSAFWLSHAPIHPNELRGYMNIHGHVHDNSIPDPRYLNVSFEMSPNSPVPVDVLIDKRNEYRKQRDE